MDITSDGGIFQKLWVKCIPSTDPPLASGACSAPGSPPRDASPSAHSELAHHPRRRPRRPRLRYPSRSPRCRHPPPIGPCRTGTQVARERAKFVAGFSRWVKGQAQGLRPSGFKLWVTTEFSLYSPTLRRVFFSCVTRISVRLFLFASAACVPATAKSECGKCVRLSPSSSRMMSKERQGHSSDHACRQS
jgi:hypothetical protein